MSKEISVITHLYEGDTCRYCDDPFKENDIVDFVYDGDPVHQRCVMKRQEE